MHFRLRHHSRTRGHFGEAGQRPALNSGLGTGMRLERRAKLLIAFAQPTSRPFHTRQTCGPDQLLRQVLQLATLFPCLVIDALYLQHRRTHQASLDIARIDV